MSVVPENNVTQADLVAWYTAKKELEAAKAKEALLRPKLFAYYFPNAEEGTNSFTLPDGYILKGVRKIARDVDMGALQTLTPQMEEKGLRVDDLFKVERKLAVSEYRKLTKEELELVDQALVIKDGMPSLDINPPSTRKAKK